MTFEQFQATRKYCADLGAALQDARWEHESAAIGNLYLDWLYIERSRGQWLLELDRSEFRSDDLELLERKLYDFAKSEQYFESKNQGKWA